MSGPSGEPTADPEEAAAGNGTGDTTPAVQATHLRKRYGDTEALAGVSLSIDAGEVYTLVGPNGAGKTTLVRALTGTTPVEGDVAVFGRRPDRVDPERLGLLPQEFSPPERLTARELIDYYGDLYDYRRDTADVLADVGLIGDADTWYENLSGGQKRRVCVALALVNDPALLILDEPTTGIDPSGRRDIWRLVEALADGGSTVLLTTHDMAEAERLADRVGLLADGRLVASGTPAALVAAHGGEPVVEVDAADEAAATRALEGAGHRIVPDERRVVVGGVAPEDVGAVADCLSDAGVDYGALTWRGPDLEGAYLNLTGYALAGDGDAIRRRAGRKR